MNRRAFLQLLSSGAVAYTLDVDKLLWIPGQKTIFLPPEGKILSYTTILDTHLHLYHNIVKDIFKQDDLFYKAIHKGQFQEARGGPHVHMFELQKRGGWR